MTGNAVSASARRAAVNNQFVLDPWQWFVNVEFTVNAETFAISTDFRFFRNFKELNNWSNEYLMALQEAAERLGVSIEIIENSNEQFDLPDGYPLIDTHPHEEARKFLTAALRKYLEWSNKNGGSLLK
jgi:hypothetical protein